MMKEGKGYLNRLNVLYTVAFTQLLAHSLKAGTLFFMEKFLNISLFFNFYLFLVYCYIGSFLISCIAFLLLIRSLESWRQIYKMPALFIILGSAGYFNMFIYFIIGRVLPDKILHLIITIAFVLIFQGYIGFISILLNILSYVELKSLKLAIVLIGVKLSILFIYILGALSLFFIEESFLQYIYFDLDFLSAFITIWIWNLVAVSTSRILASKENFEVTEDFRREFEVLKNKFREYEEYLAKLRELHDRGEISNNVCKELGNFYIEQLRGYVKELEKLREKIEESGGETVLKS